jgi:hypothetical protein
MNSFLLFSIVSSFVVLANCHAILRVPTAFNTNPSKTSPCGGGATSVAVDAAWKIGSTVQITWEVVASDGVGLVSVSFDTTGTQTFPGATTIPLVVAPAIGYFNMTFTVPQLTCNGPNATCTAQFSSSSAWFSCTTVQLTVNAPPIIVTTPTCALVNGLSFCNQLNGQYVLVPYGQTALAVDQSTATAFTATLYNPNVFTTPNSTICSNAYQNFLCHNDLPYCGGPAAACQSVCNLALQVCGISASHIGLYNCASGPVSCCQNNTYSCNPTSASTPLNSIPNLHSGGVVGSSSVLIASLMLVLFALWML